MPYQRMAADVACKIRPIVSRIAVKSCRSAMTIVAMVYKDRLAIRSQNSKPLIILTKISKQHRIDNISFMQLTLNTYIP